MKCSSPLREQGTRREYLGTTASFSLHDLKYLLRFLKLSLEIFLSLPDLVQQGCWAQVWQAWGEMFLKLPNHFCMALLVTSCKSCFPAKYSLGNGRLEKSVSQTAFFLLSASTHCNNGPITNNETRSFPSRSLLSFLCSPSFRVGFPACRLLPHTGRRHLGLMPHPAMGVYFPFSGKVDLGFITSHLKWLDTVVLFFL